MLHFEPIFKNKKMSKETYISFSSHFPGVWSTRDTAEAGASAKQNVKTTLRELIVYIVFLAILTVGKYWQRI